MQYGERACVVDEHASEALKVPNHHVTPTTRVFDVMLHCVVVASKVTSQGSLPRVLKVHTMIDDIQAELVQTQLVLDGVLRALKEIALRFVVGAWILQP